MYEEYENHKGDERMKQRCLSLLMAFFMMLTLFPANAFAREVITSEETVEAVASAEELVEDEAEEVNSDTSFTDDDFIVSEAEAEATEYAPLEADSSYVEDSISLSSGVSAYASATDETSEIDAGNTGYLDKVASSRDGSLSETALNYIRNDYIEACIRNDGRYTIGTIEGNPDISTDNNYKCNYSGGERRPRDKRACGNSFHDSMEGIHTLFFCGANVRHNA